MSLPMRRLKFDFGKVADEAGERLRGAFAKGRDADRKYVQAIEKRSGMRNFVFGDKLGRRSRLVAAMRARRSVLSVREALPRPLEIRASWENRGRRAMGPGSSRGNFAPIDFVEGDVP